MMLADAILIGLAAYGLSYLLIFESGPGDILTRWRYTTQAGPRWWKDLWACPFCLGWWLCWLLAALWHGPSAAALFVALGAYGLLVALLLLLVKGN